MKKQPSFFAHPASLIDHGAKIGAETRVWAYAHVMAGAQIGDRCNIGDYVFVEGGVWLGDDVTVKNAVQLWTGIKAEKGVFIGPGCVFTNHRLPRAFIKRPASTWLQKTLIQEGATLGAGSTIVCGTTIGRYAFVAAGALVIRDVPDFALVMGTPARFQSWRCYCSFPLMFDGSRAYCKRCREGFILNADGSRVRPRRIKRDIQERLRRRYLKGSHA